MTHVVSNALLRAVHARLEADGYGYLSGVKDRGDYTDDNDVSVDGPLKPIIAAVIATLVSKEPT